MKRLIYVCAALLLACGAVAAQDKGGLLPYQDRSLTYEQRADDLLGRLTIEEKTGLLMNNSVAVPRLGIKQYNWWSEAAHGVANNEAECFPNPIAMASSFDTDLVLDVFTAVSDEGRVLYRVNKAKGPVQIFQGLTFWTPNINIFRDPRWGRGQETYGEDPYLMGKMAVSVVKGMQGDDDAEVRKAHACVKHYAVHSGPESLRHTFDANVSERDLRETYLPAFKEAVVKGNVEEVMTAYQRFRGIPCGASDYLMNEILRDEWGYKGIITSDCWAVQDFYMEGHHEWVADAAEATAKAIKAGMNTECGNAFVHIPEAVERGLITVEDVDKCLKPLLIDRYILGEMDDIDPWENLPESIVEGPEHKALSRKMAGESIVLLKNDGILPLAKDTRIALVGPNADNEQMMWGNYNATPKNTVTLKEALKEVAPDLVYTRGCGVMGSEFTPKNTRFDGIDLDDEKALERVAASYGLSAGFLRHTIQREKTFREAFQPELDKNAVLAALDGIDVVVFAGGISSRFEGEEMPVELPGFSGGDKTDIALPAVQLELLRTLKDAGKKVIFVNFSGSAIGMEEVKETSSAILQAWYPGDEGGHAIADIIYGDVVPSAKLPVTFYKSIDQLPEFLNYDMKGHTYRFFEGEPSYEFGYGLSYTTFKYFKPRVRGGKLVVKVKNTGKVDATEVVELYVKRNGDAAGPVKTLRGFKRVHIPAGKAVKVKLPLDEETFTWWSEEDQNMVPLKGRYTLMVGTSSADANLKTRQYTYK